jgi:hypothetical protein
MALSRSRLLVLAVFAMAQGFLTGLPIVFVAKDVPAAFHPVTTFLVFAVPLVVLFLILLPEIKLHWNYAKMSATQKKAMAVSAKLSATTSEDDTNSDSPGISNSDVEAAKKEAAVDDARTGALDVERIDEEAGPGQFSSYI